MGFDRIGDILKKIQGKNAVLKQRVTEATSLSRWSEAVGSQIAKHSRAIRVQEGVLWVEVDHPIWKSELHYRKRQILELLNMNTGGLGVLSDILFLDRRSATEVGRDN
jgi:predicted nucleic acid-binding Zn ribbon protein